MQWLSISRSDETTGGPASRVCAIIPEERETIFGQLSRRFSRHE